MINFRAFAMAAFAVAVATPAFAKEEPVSFAEDVQPVLQMRCVMCHQPGQEGYEKSGFDLTSYEGLMKGTKHGPMIVPGDPYTSNLVVLVEGRADKSLQMPHGKKKLNSCDRELLRKWIKQGAKNN
ncbi:MAG TPA: c-type cytochrome domain-containing protein [Candidatus Omnitrophota bacterium]|nr:c-type cytochrome domain-containing protein [Candidatus Omnitrophota bacterium]